MDLVGGADDDDDDDDDSNNNNNNKRRPKRPLNGRLMQMRLRRLETDTRPVVAHPLSSRKLAGSS